MSKFKTALKISLISALSCTFATGVFFVNNNQTNITNFSFAENENNIENNISSNTFAKKYFKAQHKNSTETLKDLQNENFPVALLNTDEYLNFYFDNSFTLLGDGSQELVVTHINGNTLTVKYLIDNRDTDDTTDDIFATGTINKQIVSKPGGSTIEVENTVLLNIDERITLTPNNIAYLFEPKNLDTSDDNFESWNSFLFTGFSLSLNGNDVTWTENSNTVIKTDTVEYTAGQTQFFDLDIKLDTNSNTQILDDNILTLNKEGIYTITITGISQTTVDNGAAWSSTENATTSFSFMLFNENTYIIDNQPLLNSYHFEETINQQNHGKNYFYNFTKEENELPYLIYDISKYDLNLTKTFNEQVENQIFEYDKYEDLTSISFENKYENNGFVDIIRIVDINQLPTNNVKLYFKDLGKYEFEFIPKFINDTTDYSGGVVNDENKTFAIYDLPFELPKQTVHIFGTMPFYNDRDFNTGVKSFEQFRQINDDFEVEKNADITSKVEKKLNDSSLTLKNNNISTVNLQTALQSLNISPVSTNQCPVKFETNVNIVTEESLVCSVSGEAGSETLEELSAFNIATGFQNAGKYLIALKYNYDDLTNAAGLVDYSFYYQIFYFEITNMEPQIDMLTGILSSNILIGSEIGSGRYTNQPVYIKNQYSKSEFDSEIIIEIERIDFENNNTLTTRTINLAEFNKQIDKLNEDEDFAGDYLKIEENGKYRIKVYNGKNGTQTAPVVSSFTIDNTQITNIEALNVVENNLYYQTAINSGLTELNTENNIYSTNQNFVLQWDPVKASGAKTNAKCYFYPITTTSTNYTNIQLAEFILSNESVPIMQKLSLTNGSESNYQNAIDVSSSNSINSTFVQKSGGLYIFLITDEAGNESVSFVLLDNTQPKFIIKTIDGLNTNYSFLNSNHTISQDSTIIWSKNKAVEFEGGSGGIFDNEKISDTYQEFKNCFNFISNNYIKIPMLSKSYIKELGQENYSSQDNVYEKFIKSSYKLYVKENAGVVSYYVSASQEDKLLRIEPNFANFTNKSDAIEASIDSEFIVSATYNSVNDDYTFDDNSVATAYNNQDGNNLNSIYSIEGNYIFLIRDQSNTQLSQNGIELADYTNYSSAFQTITLTSDSSLCQIQYYTNDEKNNLIMADFASQTQIISGSGDDAGQKNRILYYQPTSLNKEIVVSLTPTTQKGEKTIQVESVELKFYPFINKTSSYYNIVDNQIKTSTYKTFAENPEITQVLYSYNNTENRNNLEFVLNSVNTMTQEGKYVITRTYKLPDENFIIDEYDFYKRTFEIIVDRSNTISQPEAVNKTIRVFNNLEIDDFEFEIQIIDKVVKSNVKFTNSLDVNLYYIEVTFEDGTKQTTKDMTVIDYDGFYFYDFKKDISSIKFFKIKDVGEDELIEMEIGENITETSIQSVIGQSIFISAFAEKSNAIEFPTFNENGLTDGTSFYTNYQTYNELGNDTLPVFKSNKKDLQLYIPAYKYTYQYVENTENDFKIEQNKTLCNFNDDYRISYYQLCAQIYKDEILQGTYTQANANGFIEIPSFSQAGVYKIVITQAINSANLGGQQFKNNYTFSFIIEDPEVDFTLSKTNGRQLQGINNNFYTNDKTLNISWQDNNSNLMANVDKTKIELKSNDSTEWSVLNITDDNKVKLGVQEFGSYVKNETQHNITLNLQNLFETNWFNHEKSFQIKLWLENDLAYLTQNVNIDTSAYNKILNDENEVVYTSTISKMISNFGNMFNIQEMDLRTFFDHNGNELNGITFDKSKTAYTSTKTTSNFSYFTYSVNVEFFQSLLNVPDDDYAAKFVYYKNAVNKLNETDFLETTPTSFTKESYTLLTQNNIPEDAGYYEIVESDYAGNLNIYIVHLAEESTIKFVDSNNSSNSSVQEITNQEIYSGFYTLYGSNCTYLQSIIFNSDRWTTFKIDDMPYIASPKLKNSVYNINGEEVLISQLFETFDVSSNKNKLSFFEKTSTQKHTISLALSNAANLNIQSISSQTQEGIKIQLPQNLYGEEISCFPINVKVKVSNEEIYQQTNNPNSTQDYYSSWNINNDNIDFNVVDGYLIIKFNELRFQDFDNNKIVYTIIDNFGRIYNSIQVVKADYSDKVECLDGNLYKYFINEKEFLGTSGTIKYSINNNVYQTKIFENNKELLTNNLNFEKQSYGGYTNFNFICSNNTNKFYTINVYDADDTSFETILKTINIHLYNKLPSPHYYNDSDEIVEPNPFVNFIDQVGKTIVFEKSDDADSEFDYFQTTYSSSISISNSLDLNLPFYYKKQVQKLNQDGIFEDYKNNDEINEPGIYQIIYSYQSNITDLNSPSLKPAFRYEDIRIRLEVKDSISSFYSVTKIVNNQTITVEKQKDAFIDSVTNKSYSNYYIVNTDYENNADDVKIILNNFQKVKILANPTVYQSANVTTVIYELSNRLNTLPVSYPEGVQAYNDFVVISYIKPTENPVYIIKYLNKNNDDVNIKEEMAITFAVDKENFEIDTFNIYFSKTNILQNNKINVKVIKDGREFIPNIIFNENYNILNLDISGTYQICFYDDAGNYQIFNGRTFIDVIFLKDVPFTMTHINKNGEEVETEAIDGIIVENQLKLNLKGFKDYFLSSSDLIEAKRNGKNYNPYNSNTSSGYLYNDGVFTFNEVGFYEIFFKARTHESVEIREQIYSFTIVNPDESRYALSLNLPSGFEVENVLFDDGIRGLQDKTSYFKQTNSVSYFDHSATNVLSGIWTIKINTNKHYNTENLDKTSFTFSFKINSNTPPIDVSIDEGATTTDVINIQFNAVNIYNLVGECVFTINNQKQEITKDNHEELGVLNYNIFNEGSYVIQVKTQSGNLLYSYTVNKKDPMNTWSVIAIVIGSITILATIIFVFTLRKRIKIK